MNDQSRDQAGKWQPKAETKGDAIALRLPASLDVQVRAAAGWQSAADNAALRDWMQEAVQAWVEKTGWAERHSLGQKAEASPAPTAGIDVAAVRAAANRVALQTPPKQRGAIIKAFNALVGELLANGK